MAVPMDKNIMSIWTDAGVKLFSNGGMSLLSFFFFFFLEPQ